MPIDGRQIATTDEEKISLAEPTATRAARGPGVQDHERPAPAASSPISASTQAQLTTGAHRGQPAPRHKRAHQQGRCLMHANYREMEIDSAGRGDIVAVSAASSSPPRATRFADRRDPRSSLTSMQPFPTPSSRSRSPPKEKDGQVNFS